ncbi:MAG: hypothetical protein ACR2P5_02010 [Gammaproteobacteria bacterium]
MDGKCCNYLAAYPAAQSLTFPFFAGNFRGKESGKEIVKFSDKNGGRHKKTAFADYSRCID